MERSRFGAQALPIARSAGLLQAMLPLGAAHRVIAVTFSHFASLITATHKLLICEVPHECFAEKGASNSSSATTVLFVFRVSRLIRRRLLKLVFDLVLLRVHRQPPVNQGQLISFPYIPVWLIFYRRASKCEPVTGIFPPCSR
jgi:hypothetical protein